MRWIAVWLALLTVGAHAQGLQPRPTVPITTIAGTTQILAPQSNGIQVTLIVLDGAAGNLQFEYGTGALCATGTQPLTGVVPVGVAGIVVGNGGGIVLSVPPNQALCAVTSVAMFGWMSWAQ